jgi:hypothetical protein
MMTNSQKAARGFEIVGYVMLIPAIFGLIAASFFITEAPWFTLLIWAFAGYGVALLVKYYNHSRGRLPENKIAGMWIGTIVYNLVLLLPTLYFMAASFSFERTFSTRPNDIIGLSIVFWWIIAVVGAASALKSHWNSQKLP